MRTPKSTILVVEDHPLVRAYAVEVLVEAGFEVFEAGNSGEAIAVFEDHPGIQLVFTDVEMPGAMNGVKLAHYIRDRWPPVKLIVVSGHVSFREADLPAGAMFFPKPYRDTAVVEAMIGMLT